MHKLSLLLGQLGGRLPALTVCDIQTRGQTPVLRLLRRAGFDAIAGEAIANALVAQHGCRLCRSPCFGLQGGWALSCPPLKLAAPIARRWSDCSDLSWLIRPSFDALLSVAAIQSEDGPRGHRRVVSSQENDRDGRDDPACCWCCSRVSSVALGTALIRALRWREHGSIIPNRAELRM